MRSTGSVLLVLGVLAGLAFAQEAVDPFADPQNDPLNRESPCQRSCVIARSSAFISSHKVYTQGYLCVCRVWYLPRHRRCLPRLVVPISRLLHGHPHGQRCTLCHRPIPPHR
jgi:hypothetical protein